MTYTYKTFTEKKVAKELLSSLRPFSQNDDITFYTYFQLSQNDDDTETNTINSGDTSRTSLPSNPSCHSFHTTCTALVILHQQATSFEHQQEWFTTDFCGVTTQ
jgi:hypothetical protein